MFETRWYQEEAIDAVSQALGLDSWGGRSPHKGASLIAATGSGKTYMAGRVLAKVPPMARILVLQHSEDLVEQNQRDMCLAAGIPMEDSCIWQGSQSPRPDARITFAMTQTVRSQRHLIRHYDVLVYDEAHHAPADENAETIRAVRAVNPKCRLFALTACALRADRRKLSSVGFEVCAYQVPVGVLIADGTLARPIPRIIDLGVEAATAHRKGFFGGGDGDPVVEAILGTKVSKEAIVQAWKEEALGKRTIGFASSIKQAEAMAKAFSDAGIPSRAIHSKLNAGQALSIKLDHRSGVFPVLWNAMQLTEGYDDPLIECVINLRNVGHESLAIQIFGRGLRKPNQARYPGVVKDTCVILDFGGTLARMPDLFTAPLPTEARDKKPGEAPTKACPECGHTCHLSVRECSDCGAQFPQSVRMGPRILASVKMMNLEDLKKKSRLAWKQLTPDVVVAATFDGVAIAHRRAADRPFEAWYVDAAGKATFLCEGPKDQVCSALDAYVRDSQGRIKHSASKAAPWMRRAASTKQMGLIHHLGGPGFPMTGGEASAWISWLKNKKKLVR